MRMRAAYETEFYVSDVGYLVLKQECPECGRESQFLLSPAQTEALLHNLPKMLMQQNENWTGFTDET